jgi:hypothetical protein
MVAKVLGFGTRLWQSYSSFDVMSGLLEYCNEEGFVARVLSEVW